MSIRPLLMQKQTFEASPGYFLIYRLIRWRELASGVRSSLLHSNRLHHLLELFERFEILFIRSSTEVPDESYCN